MNNLLVTSNAAKKIIELSKKKEKKMLRISVTGGGCQGFQYNLDMENQSKEKDVIISSCEKEVEEITNQYVEGLITDGE